MEYLDDLFSQFSEAFIGTMVGDGDIPHRNVINPTALNYSPESLEHIDAYLEIVYKKPPDDSSIEYQTLVVWCGAYVGEVIRRNADKEFHWIHYEEYMKGRESSLINFIPLTLTTHAFLVAINTGNFTLPMNKIARRIDEGDANNICYYANRDLKDDALTDAVNRKLKELDSKRWWKFW